MALVFDRDLEISTKTSQKVEEPNILKLHANIRMWAHFFREISCQSQPDPTSSPEKLCIPIRGFVVWYLWSIFPL